MHRYSVGGKERVANASDISIPLALAPVVRGVLSLNNFEKQPLHSRVEQVHRKPASGQLQPVPDFTTAGGKHHLVPGDFARLYDVTPLLAEGTDGAGVSIAIPGRTSIQMSDMQTFRQIFGLPPNDPTVIDNGDPPLVSQNDEYESDLDVQWAGAVAPKATVKFVTSASTFVTDGIDLSNSYIIDNKIAPIMSVSYGLCEAFLGDAGNAFYATLYQQAAVEGITVFVSSGDSGAAGCDPPEGFYPAQNGLAVNGLASTPYNIAVGGMQFNEGGDDAAYWTSNNNTDFSSALGYIPENIWNETCDPMTTPDLCSDYNLWSGSGGASAIYAKPAWQDASGMPNDGMRDLPDLSLTAAGAHDGYLICNEGSCQTHIDNGVTLLDSATVIGGTSAASPAMAGVMALVEQKNGTWLGLANDDFYKIAANDKLAKCDSSKLADPTLKTTCVFHDVTAGRNSVPGQSGYDARRGYDLASGLGTVDVANLVTAGTSRHRGRH
jgi:subtilase family serine protease